MDIFEKNVRSAIMAKVRSKNTNPEIIVRKILHDLGYRFRLHKDKLPGKPDVVLPKHKTVIFVHGCFWHGHKCKRGQRPSTNVAFWDKKLSRNIARDKKNINDLKSLGWKCMVVWECQARDQAALRHRLDIEIKRG